MLRPLVESQARHAYGSRFHLLLLVVPGAAIDWCAIMVPLDAHDFMLEPEKSTVADLFLLVVPRLVAAYDPPTEEQRSQEENTGQSKTESVPFG